MGEGEKDSPFLRACGRVDVGDIACEAPGVHDLQVSGDEGSLVAPTCPIWGQGVHKKHALGHSLAVHWLELNPFTAVAWVQSLSSLNQET